MGKPSRNMSFSFLLIQKKSVDLDNVNDRTCPDSLISTFWFLMFIESMFSICSVRQLQNSTS